MLEPPEPADSHEHVRSSGGRGGGGAAGTRGKTYVNDDGTTFYVSTCFDDSSDAMFNTFMVE